MTTAYDLWRSLLDVQVFTITQQHLDLMRRMRVSWNTDAIGAPTVNPTAPYGGPDPLGDVAEIVHATGVTPELLWLHAQAAVALQICLQTGEFRAGTYCREEYGITWHRVTEETDAPQKPPQRAAEGRTRQESILYTPETLEAVRIWLGAAYEGTRGGLTDDDPLVLWFDPTRDADLASDDCEMSLERVYPGGYLVRDERGVIYAMTPEEYRRR